MDVDELYGLTLERFVPERTALTKQLRAEGRRDEAGEVAARRKPSVAAWAVNQLVRTQRKAINELLAAGEALREAQSGVLAGRADARALRAASDRERAAVDVLVESARGLLTAGGHELSPATTERVSETLHAAALDDEARELVSAGRLERELRHAGFGSSLGDTPPAPPRRATTKTSSRPGRKPGAKKTSEPDQADERERAREREQARKAAQTAERQARREQDRAERALKTARQRHERAATAHRQATEELERADAALAKAQEAADTAADVHETAKAALER
jgi:hypothetical protein